MLSASWFTPRLIFSKKPALPARLMRCSRSPCSTLCRICSISASTATSCVRSVHSRTVPMRSPVLETTGLATMRKVWPPTPHLLDVLAVRAPATCGGRLKGPCRAPRRRADQRGARELRQVAAQVLLELADHRLEHVVDVDDLQVRIRDEHCRGGVVQSGADAAADGRGGVRLLFLQAPQLRLHVLAVPAAPGRARRCRTARSDCRSGRWRWT